MTIDHAFWKRFVAEHWSQRPALASRCSTEPLLSESEIMEGLHDVRDAILRREVPEIRVYAGQARLVTDLLRQLPEPGETDLRGYVARRRACTGASWVAIVNQFQAHQPALWHRLRRMMKPLYQIVGMPEDTVVGVFVGDYAVTPFAVHVDLDHTLYFVLRGKRRAFVWPPGYEQRSHAPWFSSAVGGSTDYQRFTDDAQIFDLDSGDLLYIPPGWWHVVELEPGPAVATSLGVPKLATTMLGDLCEARAREHMGDQVGALHAYGPELPGAHRRAAEELAASDLVEDLERQWLERVSGVGFRNPPPKLGWRDLFDDDTIAADADDIAIAVRDERVTIATHGRSFVLPRHAELERLFAVLARGGTWRVGELVAAFTARELDAAGVRNVLGKLRVLRGLRLVESV